MKILKLEWRNIFSYGDDVTEIEFGEETKVWQLTGESGSGKSSFLTIPKLLFFGKTEGSDGKPITVSEIANWLNKKGWIRGTLQKGNDIYVVERTFLPQSLTIYKNGDNLEQAGMKNMQNIIESEILDGMPYHIFSNVMILSLNNFKSFVSMTPADKRQIIDKIFALEIINKVHELVKKDMRELGNQINISNSQIFSLEQTIKTSKEQLNVANEKNLDENDKKLSELQAKIEKVSELYTNQKRLYDDVQNRHKSVSVTLEQIKIEMVHLEHQRNNIQSKIRLFGEDKCPTCGANFKSSDFDDIKTELNNQLLSLNETYDTYKSKFDETTTVMNTILDELNNITQNITKVTNKYNELTAEYNAIKSNIGDINQLSAIQNIIELTEQSRIELEKTLSGYNDKMKILDIMEGMYSSEGIKQSMMSTYIPALNQEIDDTLKFLGFPYTLSFDNNFDPHLKYLGRDIKPQSLSIGEHKKVDLTVLCSLLKMVKRKYPQLNLVCLDETVSSLDYVSSANVIRYLKEISNSMGLNIFIVSHTTLDGNLFDEHLHVEKINSYSKLKRV
jgi:DNA repair exonuclease SbcCD ATPase subunit